MTEKKKTRIGIKDVEFHEDTLSSGEAVIRGEIRLQANYHLSPEAARHTRDRDQLDTEARRVLIGMLLEAVYRDVWDLASYAEILLRQENRFRFDRYGMPCEIHPVMQILGKLSEIGKTDEGIDAILEPYRNPEGRLKK